MTAGSARVLAALGALAVVVCVPADAAEQQPNVGLAATCHGINMLDEIRAATPDVYAEIEATASKTANARAVLWKVEKAGVAPSYLLGTIHMTDPRVTVLSPQIQDALLHSDTVALEVADVSADATNAAMLKAASLVLFTDGRKLDGLLSSDEYKKVQETLSDAGLPGELAAMFRPWVVSMILSVSSCERQKVKAGQPVLDMKIATAARARGLKVVGLETIESQLAAMANIPDDQQVAMLRAGLKYVNRANDTMETLLQLYLRRNMGAAWPFHLVLARQAGVGQQSFSGFQKKIVDDRNRAMLVSAMPMLKKGRSLIAVGVLHLVGEEGLVEGLRKEGFTVTAIE
ncbi:MAG: TraB/GumN family protein [Hyphomicrobiaceae bacterium]|nr:TraB/GumN family protein [Hyphomicrobiaceae bacterium]